MTRKLAYTVHLGDGVTLLKGTEESDDTAAAFDAAGVEPGAHIWDDYTETDEGEDLHPAATPIEPVEASGAAAGVQHTPPDDGGFVPDVPGGAGEPPRAGRGSGRDAWAAYAGELGQSVAAADGRDEIIAKLEDAGLIERG